MEAGAQATASRRSLLAAAAQDAQAQPQPADFNAWILGLSEYTANTMLLSHSSSWLLQLNASAAAGASLPPELCTPPLGQPGGPAGAPLLLLYRRDWWARLVSGAGGGAAESPEAALPPTWSLLAQLLAAGLNRDLDGDGQPDHVMCADLMAGCKGWAVLSSIFASLAQTQGTAQGAWFNASDLRPRLDSPAMPAALRLYAALAAANAAPFTPGGANVSRSRVPVADSELRAGGGAVDADSGQPLCGAVNPLFAAGRCLFTLDWATAALRLTTVNRAGVAGAVGAALLPGSEQVAAPPAPPAPRSTASRLLRAVEAAAPPPPGVSLSSALQLQPCTRELCPHAEAVDEHPLAVLAAVAARLANVNVTAPPPLLQLAAPSPPSSPWLAGYQEPLLVNRAPLLGEASNVWVPSAAQSTDALVRLDDFLRLAAYQHGLKYAALLQHSPALGASLAAAGSGAAAAAAAASGTLNVALSLEPEDAAAVQQAVMSGIQHANAALDILLPNSSAYRWVLDGLAADALRIAGVAETAGQPSGLPKLLAVATEGFENVTRAFPYRGILLQLYWHSIGSAPPQWGGGPEAVVGGGSPRAASRLATPLAASLVPAAVAALLVWFVGSVLVRRRRAGRYEAPRGVKPPGPGPATTLALTDVQNSTLLWEVLSAELMDECLAIHHSIMRQAIEAHGGYEAFTEGDAFAVAFHTPDDALGFALTVQSALLSADWPAELLEQPDGCEVWARRNTHLQAPLSQGTPLLSPLATLGGSGGAGDTPSTGFARITAGSKRLRQLLSGTTSRTQSNLLSAVANALSASASNDAPPSPTLGPPPGRTAPSMPLHALSSRLSRSNTVRIAPQPDSGAASLHGDPSSPRAPPLATRSFAPGGSPFGVSTSGSGAAVAGPRVVTGRSSFDIGGLRRALASSVAPAPAPAPFRPSPRRPPLSDTAWEAPAAAPGAFPLPGAGAGGMPATSHVNALFVAQEIDEHEEPQLPAPPPAHLVAPAAALGKASADKPAPSTAESARSMRDRVLGLPALPEHPASDMQTPPAPEHNAVSAADGALHVCVDMHGFSGRQDAGPQGADPAQPSQACTLTPAAAVGSAAPAALAPCHSAAERTGSPDPGMCADGLLGVYGTRNSVGSARQGLEAGGRQGGAAGGAGSAQHAAIEATFRLAGEETHQPGGSAAGAAHELRSLRPPEHLPVWAAGGGAGGDTKGLPDGGELSLGHHNWGSALQRLQTQPSGGSSKTSSAMQAAAAAAGLGLHLQLQLGLPDRQQSSGDGPCFGRWLRPMPSTPSLTMHGSLSGQAPPLPASGDMAASGGRASEVQTSGSRCDPWAARALPRPLAFPAADPSDGRSAWLQPHSGSTGPYASRSGLWPQPQAGGEEGEFPMPPPRFSWAGPETLRHTSMRPPLAGLTGSGSGAPVVAARAIGGAASGMGRCSSLDSITRHPGGGAAAAGQPWGPAAPGPPGPQLGRMQPFLWAPGPGAGEGCGMGRPERPDGSVLEAGSGMAAFLRSGSSRRSRSSRPSAWPLPPIVSGSHLRLELTAGGGPSPPPSPPQAGGWAEAAAAAAASEELCTLAAPAPSQRAAGERAAPCSSSSSSSSGEVTAEAARTGLRGRSKRYQLRREAPAVPRFPAGVAEAEVMDSDSGQLACGAGRQHAGQEPPALEGCHDASAPAYTLAVPSSKCEVTSSDAAAPASGGGRPGSLVFSTRHAVAQQEGREEHNGTGVPLGAPLTLLSSPSETDSSRDEPAALQAPQMQLGPLPDPLRPGLARPRRCTVPPLKAPRGAGAAAAAAAWRVTCSRPGEGAQGAAAGQAAEADGREQRPGGSRERVQPGAQQEDAAEGEGGATVQTNDSGSASGLLGLVGLEHLDDGLGPLLEWRNMVTWDEDMGVADSTATCQTPGSSRAQQQPTPPPPVLPPPPQRPRGTRRHTVDGQQALQPLAHSAQLPTVRAEQAVSTPHWGFLQRPARLFSTNLTDKAGSGAERTASAGVRSPDGTVRGIGSGIGAAITSGVQHMSGVGSGSQEDLRRSGAGAAAGAGGGATTASGLLFRLGHALRRAVSRGGSDSDDVPECGQQQRGSRSSRMPAPPAHVTRLEGSATSAAAALAGIARASGWSVARSSTASVARTSATTAFAMPIPEHSPPPPPAMAAPPLLPPPLPSPQRLYHFARPQPQPHGPQPQHDRGGFTAPMPPPSFGVPSVDLRASTKRASELLPTITANLRHASFTLNMLNTAATLHGAGLSARPTAHDDGGGGGGVFTFLWRDLNAATAALAPVQPLGSERGMSWGQAAAGALGTVAEGLRLLYDKLSAGEALLEQVSAAAGSGTGPREGGGEPELVLRGLRVRVGLHSGPEQAEVELVAERGGLAARYCGDFLTACKEVSDAAVGGMVLLSGPAFRAYTQLRQRSRPLEVMLLHCGEHVVRAGNPDLDAATTHTLAVHPRSPLQPQPSGPATRELFAAVSAAMVSRLALLPCPVRTHQEVLPGCLSAPAGVVAPVFCNVLGVEALLAWERVVQERLMRAASVGLDLGAEPSARGPNGGASAIGFDSTAGPRAGAVHLALDMLRDAVSDITARHGGYVVASSADGGHWVLVFGCPEAAVRWGLDMLEAMLETAWPAGFLEHELTEEVWEGGVLLKRGLRLRIGIDYGQAMVRLVPRTGRLDYVGRPMNRAARIAAKAKAATVLASDAVWSAARGSLGPLVSPASLGAVRLKGVREAVELWALRARQQQQQAAQQQAVQQQ